MKAKITIIISILFIAFAGCKQKPGADENVSQPQNDALAVDLAKDDKKNRGISGTITLSSNSRYVIVNCILKVRSANFNYIPEPVVFNGQLKGIGFRYMDVESGCEDFHEPGPHDMPVQFILENSMNWRTDDKVRLMAVNENRKADFDELVQLGYFTDRMNHFRLNNNISPQEFENFNTQWNAQHTNTERTRPYSGSTTGTDCNEEKLNAILTPRITKKDIILSITRG